VFDGKKEGRYFQKEMSHPLLISVVRIWCCHVMTLAVIFDSYVSSTLILTEDIKSCKFEEDGRLTDYVRERASKSLLSSRSFGTMTFRCVHKYKLPFNAENFADFSRAYQSFGIRVLPLLLEVLPESGMWIVSVFTHAQVQCGVRFQNLLAHNTSPRKRILSIGTTDQLSG
jgi:hypothetical protein